MRLSNNHSSALIIFIKNPVEGKVKTRIAKNAGNRSALKIYLQLLLHTREITKILPVKKFLFYSDFLDIDDHWSQSIYSKHVQTKGDLGERMKAAFNQVFNYGYKKVIIIGCDCLELSTLNIIEAFDALEYNDAVIGPAADGGYYLLGIKEKNEQLFYKKNWGNQCVFRDTIADMNAQQLTIKMLSSKNDIDTIEDLPASLSSLILLQDNSTL